MKEHYLEVTFRKGKPLAAYLYLPHQEGKKSKRAESQGSGLLVDYDENGLPIGIEITTPSHVSVKKVNEILHRLNLPPISEEELLPLESA
jgi:uncharacterized protein YuzE